MRPFVVLAIICASLYTGKSFPQSTVSYSELESWNAQWIAAQNDSGTDYGVYKFRKSIELTSKPSSFVVHMSADNRYKLYVNGNLVSLGPARGDTFFWNYETVDLAQQLKEGKNTISALVWNEGEHRPHAQISVRTGFIVQGNSPTEQVLNTNNTWKVVRDEGHQPIPGYFFAASKGEMVDMSKTIKGDWTSDSFDDSEWPAAAKVLDGKLKGNSDGLAWQLVPSSIPPMEMKYQRIPVLRKVEGMKIPSGFPSEKRPVIVPANSKVSLLLDQTFETNAYLTLNFSGGEGAGISIGYAESLYEKGSNGRRKGNRDVIKGKEFIGRIDSLLADGRKDQSFTTLNYRTYRYIRLVVETKNEPLVIEDIYGTFTGYPFKFNAVLNTKNQEMQQIMDIGWRTARLNAWETYMDCPYYEQLQYIGDTRIQAMVSYYNSGDDRLARNALDLIDHSRLPEGITMSRYPTRSTQIITPFSLWYIGMLHDYWMYRDDGAFLKDKLTGQRAILEFFSEYQQPDGSLKDLPYWKFVDWAGNLGWGPDSPDGSAAIYDLQLLMAYQWAADLETDLGLELYAKNYEEKAEQLKATIQRKYWDPKKGLYADTKEKSGFSQHVNSLAILTGLVDEKDQKDLAEKLLEDESLTQCSIYFKYYLHQALVEAGLGNDFMDWLGIWRENIELGLTTWAEDSGVETARSDCHAWGASPNIEFFRTVLGIDSDAPGFKKIKIEPHLGTITDISGEMPHPNGKVAVDYSLNQEKWEIKVELPENTTGNLVWKGSTYELKAGANKFIL